MENRKCHLSGEKSLELKGITYIVRKSNGVYVNIGTSIRNQIEDQNVKNIIIQLFLKKLEGEQKKYEKN